MKRNQHSIFRKLGFAVLLVCMTILMSVPAFAATKHSTVLNGTDYKRVYDYTYYTTKVHKELKGKSDKTVLTYFVNTGMSKGEQASASFDPKSYRRGNRSLRVSYKFDWPKYYKHFMTKGYKYPNVAKTATGITKITKPVTTYNGTDYARVYNYYYYITRYKGVAKAYPEDDVKALAHFVKFGMKQEKQGCKSFSEKSYRYANQALRIKFLDNYEEYYKYYMKNPSKYGGATGVKTLKNPVTKLEGIEFKTIFDYKYYTANNSAVAKYGVSRENNDAAALVQFMKVGIYEGKVAKKGVKPTSKAYKAVLAKVRQKYPSGGTPEAIKADKYASDTKYLILLDRGKHTIYIFQGKQGNWTKIKTFPCCTGAPDTPTVSGVFRVQDRGAYFKTGKYYQNRCWYWTRIYKNYLFHSQIYNGNSSPTTIIDGRMGVSCSHGCVRMYLSDCKYIYDNIPTGSKIVIYN